jgi:hypothetical protein
MGKGYGTQLRLSLLVPCQSQFSTGLCGWRGGDYASLSKGHRLFKLEVYVTENYAKWEVLWDCTP